MRGNEFCKISTFHIGTKGRARKMMMMGKRRWEDLSGERKKTFAKVLRDIYEGCRSMCRQEDCAEVGVCVEGKKKNV